MMIKMKLEEVGCIGYQIIEHSSFALNLDEIICSLLSHP